MQIINYSLYSKGQLINDTKNVAFGSLSLSLSLHYHGIYRMLNVADEYLKVLVKY